MAARMAEGVPQADGSIRSEPTFDPAKAARMAVHMASLLLDANARFVTTTATAMPLIGRE